MLPDIPDHVILLILVVLVVGRQVLECFGLMPQQRLLKSHCQDLDDVYRQLIQIKARLSELEDESERP